MSVLGKKLGTTMLTLVLKRKLKHINQQLRL